jgi:DNA-binding response OmpR family regulator
MRKRRILLVDDEIAITRALAIYLAEQGGCEVRIENEGSRAVAAALDFTPDLILLDVVMPDADGGALAAQMKAEPALQHVPIVFLTALVSRHETRSASKTIGGLPFLAKPVDPHTVLEYIDRHVVV